MKKKLLTFLLATMAFSTVSFASVDSSTAPTPAAPPHSHDWEMWRHDVYGPAYGEHEVGKWINGIYQMVDCHWNEYYHVEYYRCKTAGCDGVDSDTYTDSRHEICGDEIIPTFIQ